MKTSSEEDFVSFYRAHWPRLVAALAWSLPKGEDPRDVAQEAFVRAFERWSAVRSHPRPDAWLFLTAYRFAGKIRRRRARERQLMDTAASDPGNLGAAAEVHEILARLSPRQRAAVILRHHYGLSTRESARVLRCKEGTVKSLVARAKVV